jgi:hypothetical protein
VGKPEGKRPLGRPRRRWEDGIRMDLGEIGLGVWIGFDWLRTGTATELDGVRLPFQHCGLGPVVLSPMKANVIE